MVRPAPLILLGGSVIPPVTLIPTGADYELRRFSQTDLGGSYNPEPVTVALPYVALPTTLAVWGIAAAVDACHWQKAPTAMLQGAFWTISVVALSKWIVGRTWPTGGRDPYAPDRLEHPEDGQTFAPFQAGLAAFPSGHTATMFALAAAFRESSPELGVWRYLGYPIAVGVGFGMWWGDHHWASDVLSGAMLGEALGGSAGRAWSPEQPPEVSLSYIVVPTPGGAAAAVTGFF